MNLPEEPLAHLNQCEQLVESLNTRGAAGALQSLEGGRARLEDLMKLAGEQRHCEIQARTAMLLGKLDYRLGPWGSARSLLRSAWTAAANPRVSIALFVAATDWCADIDLALDDPLQAHVYVHLGLTLARSAGLRRATSTALTKLAFLETRFGDPGLAEQRLREAGALVDPGDYSGRAGVLRGLARIREKESKVSETLALRHQILECQQAGYDAVGEALSRMSIGYHYWLAHEYDVALEWILPAYSLAREIVHPWCTARILSGMGHVYEGQGRRTEAVAAWIRSEFILGVLGSPEVKEPRGALLAIAGLPGGKLPSGPPSSLLKSRWSEIL